MQITGKITSIWAKQIVGTKQTEKQSIRVEETTGQYPNSLVIDFFGKKIEIVAKYKVGDNVVVEFNSRTSSHNDKTYNNISGRSVALSGEQTDTQRFDKERADAILWDDLPF